MRGEAKRQDGHSMKRRYHITELRDGSTYVLQRLVDKEDVYYFLKHEAKKVAASHDAWIEESNRSAVKDSR